MAQKWPKITQNCPNWPKNDPKLPKWPKNDPKWPKNSHQLQIQIAEIYLQYLHLFPSLPPNHVYCLSIPFFPCQRETECRCRCSNWTPLPWRPTRLLPLLQVLYSPKYLPPKWAKVNGMCLHCHKLPHRDSQGTTWSLAFDSEETKVFALEAINSQTPF